MENHGISAVKLFYWASALVGVPSTIGTLFFGGFSLVLWMQKPVANTSADAKVSDSLVNVVVQLAGLAGKALTFFGDIVEGMIRGAAILSLCGLVFAGMIFLTGRGLAENAFWAKVAGSVLMLILLLVSGLGTLTPMLGPYRVLPLMLLVLSGYTLWAIWRGLV